MLRRKRDGQSLGCAQVGLFNLVIAADSPLDHFSAANSYRLSDELVLSLMFLRLLLQVGVLLQRDKSRQQATVQLDLDGSTVVVGYDDLSELVFS